MSRQLIKALMFYRAQGAATTRNWSNAAGWGGTVPVDGASVVIGNGDDVTLDTTTARLTSLVVQGTGILRVSTAVDTQIFTRYMEVSGDGKYLVGGWTWAGDGFTPVIGTPSTKRHTRTMIGPGKTGAVRGPTHTSGSVPTGNDSLANDDFGVHRGFMVMDNGQYLVNSYVPPVLNTRIQGHLSAGATTLTLMEPVTWKAGDVLLIPPTGYYNASKRTERKVVAADVNNSTTVTLTTGLGYDRWGLLQYPTDTGISLSPGTFVTKKASSLVPTVIDQRAKVFNLSRLATVEGENDTTLTVDNIGAHDMYMGMGIRVRVHGAQYRNCGQMGLLGRYPIHFHRNAYNNDGTTKTNPWTGTTDGLFAIDQCVIENVSVIDSLNRVHSAHACKGVVFKRVIADNFAGAGFFMEDGAEVKNTWAGCFGTRSYDPGPTMRLKAFDATPTVWWITHPDNKWLKDGNFLNGGADVNGHGVTVANGLNRTGFPGSCVGASAQVPLQASHFGFNTLTSVWEGVEGHSCTGAGLIAANNQGDEEGNLIGQPGDQIKCYNTGIDSNDGDKEVATHFIGDFLWKNLGAGYINNQFHPLYDQRLMVDNDGPDFTGNTQFGEIINTLFVSESLNVADIGMRAGATNTRVGMIAYHGNLVPQNCSVFGYTTNGVPYLRANGDRFRQRLEMPAFVGTNDTYLFPLIGYHLATTGNKFFGSGPHVYTNPHPTLQILSPFTTWTGGTHAAEPGTGATAYWDPHGDMFGAGVGRYILLDHPSITYGCANLSSVLSADGNYIGMTSTTTPMQGVQWSPYSLYEDGTNAGLRHIRMQRCDTSFADVSGAAFTMVKDANGEYEASTGTSLGYALGGNHDLHFCLPAGGIVRIFNPDDTTKRWQSIWFRIDTCENSINNWVIIGIPMLNTRDPGLSWMGFVANTGSALISHVGDGYWRDTAREIVWVKMNTAAGYVFDRKGDGYNAIGTYYHGLGTDFRQTGLNM